MRTMQGYSCLAVSAAAGGFGVVQIMYGPTNPDPCLINLSP